MFASKCKGSNKYFTINQANRATACCPDMTSILDIEFLSSNDNIPFMENRGDVAAFINKITIYFKPLQTKIKL